MNLNANGAFKVPKFNYTIKAANFESRFADEFLIGSLYESARFESTPAIVLPEYATYCKLSLYDEISLY